MNIRKNHLRSPLLGSVAVLASAGIVHAAEIEVTRAEIAGGKLVIAGTTSATNAKVRLDGRAEAAFNASADQNGAFKFSLAYVPSDCVVSLRISPAAAEDVAISGCARGLTPRGGWNGAAAYAANDVVTHKGASWLARRDNAGKPPAASADWQMFAVDVGDDAAASKRVPPTGPAGGDLAGSYPNPIVKNGAIIASRIAAGAVTTAKLANGVVGVTKLSNAAVESAKIADAAVTAAKIADGAVSASKVATDAITNAKMANGSVGSAEIIDNAVTSAKIASSSVGGAELIDNAVTNAKMADNSVGNVEIIDNSIGTDEIIDNAVIGSKIADGSVTGADVFSESLTGSDIADGSVASADVLNDSLTGSDIAESTLDLSGAFVQVEQGGDYVFVCAVANAWRECAAVIVNVPANETYRVLIDSAGSFLAGASANKVRICTSVRNLNTPFDGTQPALAGCVNQPTGITMAADEMKNATTNGTRLLPGGVSGATYSVSTAVRPDQALTNDFAYDFAVVHTLATVIQAP